jgi:hypothetical protein
MGACCFKLLIFMGLFVFTFGGSVFYKRWEYYAQIKNLSFILLYNFVA